MSRKSKPTRTRKQLAIRKHRRHVIFYVVLGTAIVAAKIFIPEVAATAYGEVKSLWQILVSEADNLTVDILALVGLGYALKQLWNAFRK